MSHLPADATSSDAGAPVPRVSVLLPCYNAARYLPSCLDSLLAQTLGDFEVLAIDDGSRDQTPNVLAEYAARDRRIRIRRNETNIGLIRTLNLGIDACRGEYIARMDADDEAEPKRFQTQVAFLDARRDVDVVSSSFNRIDVAGRRIGHRRVWVTHPVACRYVTTFATPVAHGAIMARRDCLTRFRYSRDPKSLHTEDYELWARMARAGGRLANIAEPLYRVRISPESVSSANEGVQVQNFITCVQDHLRAETGEETARQTVEVLANRIDFDRRDVRLGPGLRMLSGLTQSALSGATTPEERAEIAGAAAMQRLDILLQCVLKGRPGLRARASGPLLAELLAALGRPAVRRYLTQKLGA